jgi:hypothetical protein
MKFSEEQLKQLRTAARALPFDAPLETVADFITRILEITPGEEAAIFGDADSDELTTATNTLTKEQERILLYDGQLPRFAVVVQDDQPDRIAGLGTVMGLLHDNPKLVARLAHHAQIRAALVALEKGHHLEAVAAAILHAACDSASATIGSSDQGIDAFAWQACLPASPLFAPTPLDCTDVMPMDWEKIYFLASSKANLSQDAKPDPINPAFIRELVGGWLLQRTGTGKWSQLGILPLSPVQLVLVTTYRISPAARGECMSLGVQVWALPELIFFIAKYAPDDVFAGATFDVAAFAAWWQTKDESRINYEELAAAALGT